MPFDDCIKIITGPKFTKLEWLVHFVILMHKPWMRNLSHRFWRLEEVNVLGVGLSF